MEKYKLSNKKIQKIINDNNNELKKSKINFKKIFNEYKDINLIPISNKKIYRIIEKLQNNNITLDTYLKTNWTDEKFFFKIGDYIRYSIIINNDIDYCDTIIRVINILIKNNYSLEKCKSFLPIGDGYTGVNIIVYYNNKNKIKIPIEVQFHTKKTSNLKYQPIKMRRKDYHIIKYIYNNFKNVMNDNLNPYSIKFLNDLLNEINNNIFVLNQHKTYRLLQIINILNSQNKIYNIIGKKKISEIKNLSKYIMKKQIIHEKKSLSKSLSNCLNNNKLDVYCKNIVKPLSEDFYKI